MSENSKIKLKISTALKSLGSAFTNTSGIVTFSPDTETASWSYNKLTGQEKIIIGKLAEKIDAGALEILLRHEFLHKSSYHGKHEKMKDKELQNLAYDIAINRILFITYPYKTESLCKAAYPPESDKTIIAFANPCADKTKLKSALGKKAAIFWDIIWNTDYKLNSEIDNPYKIYLKLSEFREFSETSDFLLSPFTIDHDEQKTPQKEIAEITSKIYDEIRGKDSLNQTGISEFIQVKKSDSSADNVKKFINSLKLIRYAKRTANEIERIYSSKITRQPYPVYPSRIGMIYRQAGISRQLKLYFNKTPDRKPSVIYVSVYIDISPSMEDNFPHILKFLKELKGFVLQLKTFDTEVRDVDWDNLKNKTIERGMGTDFNAPVKDFLNDSVNAAILITDGEADLDKSLGRSLSKYNKKIFAVYLNSPFAAETSVLNKYAHQTVSLTINE
ncbi:MAG: hypothetical protein ACQESP_13240 [Candidatus Muiribacteriota bacterium]